MNTLRQALRMVRRDWRAGELSVLIAALVLAAASVGTVGFFADRCVRKFLLDLLVDFQRLCWIAGA